MKNLREWTLTRFRFPNDAFTASLRRDYNLKDYAAAKFWGRVFIRSTHVKWGEEPWLLARLSIKWDA